MSNSLFFMWEMAEHEGTTESWSKFKSALKYRLNNGTLRHSLYVTLTDVADEAIDRIDAGNVIKPVKGKDFLDSDFKIEGD